ncbi:Cof-type HAD-IIB family hydrolase [Bacillus sp. FJAT-50079]|uniref:Cof-type HAD-IIB family hydrolase n=1 Tax=Bacillus sp. FJAT-50079 TaxID=2833577 RepID=UPI001BC99FCD|nr:Cof-type HAD-IIB family hydrolase [Bacillus sp. FJAT-50079]MBS4207250.1 HAD family phosphatase [Bacillus sp. FJAT-50079]
MVELIAIDLDGTLLNEENQISKKNLEALEFAQANGVEVVIATGRAHFDVQTIFKDTGLKTWIIGANGATIHQPNGELFHSVSINQQDAFQILNWLEQEQYYYEVFSNDSIFTPQNGRELLAIEMDRMKSANPEVSNEQLIKAAEKQYSQSGFSFISSYNDLINTNVDVYNILAFSFDEEKLQKGKAQFKNMKDVTMVTSAEHNFEFEHIKASKGIALEILTKRLELDLVDTAAVGDNFNDLSMLRIAGRSAAMANAPEEIRNACQEITLTNSDDGVAHFIYSLLRSTL